MPSFVEWLNEAVTEQHISDPRWLIFLGGMAIVNYIGRKYEGHDE